MVTSVDPNALRPEERAQLMRRRRWFVIALGLVLFLSLVLPHVALTNESGYGRSLLTTSFYFLNVQPAAFGGGVDPYQLAFGFNVTYLGLALHQLGLLLSAATFWCLYPVDINRWIYRLMMIGGWSLALSTPFLVTGRLLIGGSGVPVTLGFAWLFVLLGGITIVVAGRRAKDRIDRTWYLAGPELM